MNERKGFTKEEKEKMKISSDTLKGLKMTGTLLFYVL